MVHWSITGAMRREWRTSCNTKAAAIAPGLTGTHHQIVPHGGQSAYIVNHASAAKHQAGRVARRFLFEGNERPCGAGCLQDNEGDNLWPQGRSILLHGLPCFRLNDGSPFCTRYRRVTSHDSAS